MNVRINADASWHSEQEKPDNNPGGPHHSFIVHGNSTDNLMKRDVHPPPETTNAASSIGPSATTIQRE